MRFYSGKLMDSQERRSSILEVIAHYFAKRIGGEYLFVGNKLQVSGRGERGSSPFNDSIRVLDIFVYIYNINKYTNINVNTTTKIRELMIEDLREDNKGKKDR